MGSQGGDVARGRDPAIGAVLLLERVGCAPIDPELLPGGAERGTWSVRRLCPAAFSGGIPHRVASSRAVMRLALSRALGTVSPSSSASPSCATPPSVEGEANAST